MNTTSRWTSVVCACFFAALSARAEFVITSFKEVVGPNDVYRVFVQNDGQGGSGVRLLALSVRFTADANLIFAITDADGDGVLDADVNLRTVPADPPMAAVITGSYVRFGSVNSFLIAANHPEGYSDADGNFITDPGGESRYTAFLATNTFRVDGFNSAGGIEAIAPIQFAAIVAPHDSLGYLAVSGFMVGAFGPQRPVAAVIVPEPGALGAIGLGVAGFIRRRARS